MAAIKSKIAIGLIKRLLEAAERLIESQEALAIAIMQQTKTLKKMEKLLDEIADIQAQTRDAVLPKEQELV